MTAREVTLLGGSPWGFRMHGGSDLHQPLRISRVNPGSKAAQQGVREGDLISSINGKTTRNLTNSESHDLLRSSGEQLNLRLNQDGTGSPKRRIYKSSLQESTSTETLKRITTKTVTSNSTRLVQTSEKKINGSSDDAKSDERINIGQNGSVLNDFTNDQSNGGDLVKIKGRGEAYYEDLDYATDAEEGKLCGIMPNNSRSRKNRKNRNRKRFQPVSAASVDKNPSNDFVSEELVPHNEINENADSESLDSGKTKDSDFPPLDVVPTVNVDAPENLDSEKDDVVYESLNFSKRKPRNRFRIEKRSLDTGTRICEITTIENVPCEARVDHIPGVGILETGIAKAEEPLVTVLEPMEPLSKSVASKVETLGGKNFALALLAKNNSLDIHEVSDSDVEPDNSRVVVVEAESDVEREPVGEILKVGANGLAKAESLEEDANLEMFYDNLKRDVEDGGKTREDDEEEEEEVPLTAEEEELLKPEPPMSKEVEEKLRCFIEGLNLPASPEEARDECAKVEEENGRTNEEEESKAQKKAKKRAILESYFSQSQAANRFLGIIQEEGEKLSEDDEQHIRDFINEEISKYRREERKLLEEENSGDISETPIIPEVVFLKESSSDSPTSEENVYENIEFRKRETSPAEVRKVTASVEELPVVEDIDRIKKDRAPEPPKRSSSFNNDIEPQRPPTPPETDYPEELPAVPPLPEGVDASPKVPPHPPVRRKSVHFAEDEETIQIPERPATLHLDECIADSIYENVNLTRSTCTHADKDRKVRVCQSNVKTEQNTVDFIKTLLTILTQRNTTYHDVQRFLSGFDLGVLPKNIRDIIDELMEPNSRASSESDNGEIAAEEFGGEAAPGTAHDRDEMPTSDGHAVSVVPSLRVASQDDQDRLRTGAGREEATAVAEGGNKRLGRVTREIAETAVGSADLRVKNNPGIEVEEALYTTSALSPTESFGQDSSSSTASVSTAKYNPERSSLTDVSSAFKDETSATANSPQLKRKLKLLDKEEIPKEQDEQDSPQPIPYSPVEEFYYSKSEKVGEENPDETGDGKPDLLKDLCIKKILSLPYGEQIINEITLPKFNIFKNIQTIQETVNEKHANKPFADEVERNLDSKMSGNPNSWMGIPTKENPQVFVCLSPSQQATGSRTSADRLLDLHRKFVERRSYHEEEKREIRTVKEHRVEVRREEVGSAPLDSVGVDDARNGGGCSSRWSGDWHIPMSGNRLLEIIKENSVADPSEAGGPAKREAPVIIPRSKEAIYNYYGAKCSSSAPSCENKSVVSKPGSNSGDNHKHAMRRVPSLEESQERLRATRLSDWLNLARRNSVDDMNNAPKMSAHLLIEESTRIGGGKRETTDNSSFDGKEAPSSSVNKAGSVVDGTGSGTADFTREERLEKISKVTKKSAVGKFGESVPGDRHPTVNSALIDESRPEVPLRVPGNAFSRNPISCNSAIIDKSGLTVEFDRRTPIPRKIEGKHSVNPALINDRPEVPPKVKRTVDVDRSCIDTTSIFDKTPPRNHLRKRRHLQEGEKVKKVTAVEIMENLKQLQTEMKQRHGESRRSSLPQEYFDQQLGYIEQLEEQLKNVIIAEEEEQKAFEGVVRQAELGAKPRPHSVIGGPSLNLKDFDGISRDSWTEKERENGDDGFREMDAWHEESKNMGKEWSEFVKKDGRRETSKKTTRENGCRTSEESKSSESREERFVVSKRSGEVVERVQPRLHTTERTERPKSTISAVATSGEKFREQMYNEYVNKVQEREERKQQKLIKISSHVDIGKRDGSARGESIENEFMARAKNRLDKFGIKLDESESEVEGQPVCDRVTGQEFNRYVIDGDKVIDIKTLPKHLQEFLKLATAQDESDARGKGYETDLLHEIDKALKFGKGFLLGGGVWSPGSEPPKSGSPDRGKEGDPSAEKDAGIPPVWTPTSATASPVSERKEFRPVQFESPVLSRKNKPVQTQSSTEEAPPPWEGEEYKREASQVLSQTITTRIVNSHSAPSQGLNTLASLPRLPRAQNPTITLLQKAREGQLPKGAAYLEEGENAHTVPSKNEDKPIISPGEIIYTVKKEYESETELENDRPIKKMADLGPRKFEGIGPITKEGIPLVLRSEVKENNQAKWYKKMYDSLHRAENDEDYITIRYKPRRGTRYGYGSASGYLSEPEPRVNNPERSATLDSRRKQRNKENDFATSTIPRKNGNAVKHATDLYRNQPGRIEDYEPGRSSIADKETKEPTYDSWTRRKWWDEIMDIFNGPFEQHSTHTAKPYMSHALKESGYESDSTLVFRRREDASPLSPLEQRLAYKTVQRGGDVPLHGLRKPAPERPKEVKPEIEYFPISPTLTRIRIHKKIPSKDIRSRSSAPVPPPPPLPPISSSMIFSQCKRSAPSLAVTAGRSPAVPSPPPGRPPSRTDSPSGRAPSPPRRRSSRNNTTLRLYSKVHLGENPHLSNRRHEQCFSADSVCNIRFLRDRLSSNLEKNRRDKEESQHRVRVARTLSSSPVAPRTKSWTQFSSVSKADFGSSRSSSGPERLRTRATPSPSPVARQSREFGSTKRQAEDKAPVKRVPSKSPMSNSSSRDSTVDRLYSPERNCQHGSRARVDASPRKDLRPRRTRKEQEESCKRLSRSPELVSPQEVKRVGVQRQTREKEAQTKVLPSGTVVKSSTTLYSSSRSGRQNSQEDKSLKVTVAISSKGRELLRRTTEASTTSGRSVAQTSKPSSTGSPVPVRKTTFGEAVETSRVKSTSFQNPDVRVSSFEVETSGAGESVRRKRPRDNKPQTIVKSSIKKPETISINPEAKERREEKRKSRKEQRNGDSSKGKSKSSSNGKRSDSEKKKAKKALGKAAGSEVAKELRKLEPKETNVQRLTVEQIKRHQESMKSDTFFQNLFLRNAPSPTPSQISVLRKCSVLDRARMFQRGEGSENLKSEPSLRSLNIYLTSKKPVSNSKFKNWERESVSSKCSSPHGVSWPGRSILQKISKFDSLLSIDDLAPEFGSVSSFRGRSPDLTRDCGHKEPRSLSEPPLKVLCEKGEEEIAPPRPASPSPIRSPACRRIQSLRQPQDPPGMTIVRKARARSAEEVEQRRKFISGSTFSLCKSTSSLNLSQADRDEYQNYVLEMLHRRRKSKRYKDLHDFYASLERIGELERTTSTGDLRPRLRNEEIIDYDRWKEVRSKERAEIELETLYGKLRSAQKEKDFLFRPKEVEQFRWKGDSGLRCKEKSVENIRDKFKKLESEESELESSRRRDMAAKKDVYKPLWRGNSVVSVANTLDRQAAFSENSESRGLKPELPKALGVSRKLWSSLSIDQVNALKNQLNEIYSAESGKAEVDGAKRETPKSEFEIVVPAQEEFGDEGAEDDGKTLHVRCHSMVTPDVCKVTERAEESGLKRSGSISRGRSVERSQSERATSSASVTPGMSELEKKRLSLTLSREVLDKVTQKNKTGGGSLSSASPRTCYSLEMSEEGGAPKSKEKNDFLLVLTPADESPKVRSKVENVLDQWAKKAPEIPMVATDETVGKSAANSEVDSTTESSEASVRTVIRLGPGDEVPRKVEFFEKIDNAVSAEPTMRSDKRAQSFSQSFADLKELFGESESAKFSGIPSYVSRPRSTSPRRSPAASLGSRRSRLPDEDRERPRSVSPYRAASIASSSDSLWKRSESPDPERYWRAYLKLVRNGAVKRLRAKYESLEELPGGSAKIVPTPKRFQSDPELTRNLLKRVVVKGQEIADVNWLRRKYEPRVFGRGRRRGASPPVPRVPLRMEDLGMPRIHVISKLAELKGQRPSLGSTSRPRLAETSELESKRAVGRIRRKFEPRDEDTAGVSILEYASTAPPPPPKAPHYKVDRQESPRRYVEGEVTIHYRSPVRTEAKEVLSEAELARRSAENMRRVYQEERRRKYLQELHDIDSRRHTDNFTPSQKSPIPLNRYDDFVDDLSNRSRSQDQTPEPRLVAKALYNFVGQSSRELTFRRGDIIFVRRQVDKNWYEGEHNAMVGLFPFNYVEILPYDGIRATSAPKKPHEGQARAKFNFVAQTTHELSLVKGDLVVLTRRVDENWYEGRIGNRKGIFPISYVEVLAEPGVRTETPAHNKPVAAPAAHSLLSNGSAGGKLSMGPHHYTPTLPTSLNVAPESHYNSLPRMGGYKLQVAPVNETLHIDTHSEPMRYRALYNYRPQNDDELELKEGDTVYVMEKCDDGWFVGSSQRTGCFGTFPGNYVDRL